MESMLNAGSIKQIFYSAAFISKWCPGKKRGKIAELN